MANVYTAVALDATSRERLLGAVTIPEGWKTYAEHMTVDLKPLAKSMAAELGGQTKSLTVVALGISEAAMAIENRNQLMSSRSEDFGEGMRAFLEKRKPVYKNR